MMAVILQHSFVSYKENMCGSTAFFHSPMLLKFHYGFLFDISLVLSKRTWSPYENLLSTWSFSSR